MARQRVKIYLVGREYQDVEFNNEKDGKPVKIHKVHLHLLQVGNDKVLGMSSVTEAIDQAQERMVFDGYQASDLLFYPVRLERITERNGKSRVVAIDPAGDPDDLSKFLAAQCGGRIVDLAKAPRMEYAPVGFDDDDE